jgi:arginase
VTTILVPFHQDERLPDGSIPLPADGDTVVVDVRSAEADLWRRLVALYDAVADTVAAQLTHDRLPIVVSGDCLVALGTVAGAQRAGVEPAVVWFDAHGDVHTEQSSTSGYLGGMALRFVLGAHPDRAAEPLGLRPLPERQAILVDARDLDPAERDFLAGSDLARQPVPEVGPDTLPDGPLILHVDLDVIDAGELPGLRFPAADGPSRAAVVDAVRRVLGTGRVVAVDLVCSWYPAGSADDEAVRADLLADLLALPHRD